MNKLSLYAILFSVAGAFGASAETIVFDPGQTGEDTITDPGFQNFVEIDLNQDGYRDIELGINGGNSFPNGGFVAALSDQFRFVGGPPNGGQTGFFDSFEAAYQEVYISSTNGVADLFEAGDEVGVDTFGDDRTFESLFGNPNGENAIPNVGDGGFLGFRIDIGTSIYEQVDGFLPTGFNGPVESFYAFLEVEQGSLIFGTAGYNNVAGQAARIPGGPPVIPLPAGFPLLLAGLGTFAFVKRRKKQA